MSTPLDFFLAYLFDMPHAYVMLVVSPCKIQNPKLPFQLNWGSQNKVIDTSYTFLWWKLLKMFWEIKENVAMEKTVEFHSFDQTIGFLSFWHIDLTCLCFIENFHEKCKDSRLSLQLNRQSENEVVDPS